MTQYNEQMRLILTHENADFDAIASMWAAHKLHPDTQPLLPRRINRNVEQFLTLYWDAFRYMRATEWRRRKVDTIILVDTQGLNSVKGVVRKPSVLVIDHHSQYTTHDKWSYEIAKIGATTTLLIEKIQQSGLSLTPEEATLFLLGIYEDTGSLTYDSTTSRDMMAAAWLVEQGAMLSVVREFMNVPLTLLQRQLYDSLQTAVRWFDINGQTLVITAAEAPDGYQEEVSSVVHRLRDALAIDGLFVLVHMGRDVQFVARSRNKHVDVAYVARKLGGGGHNRAAAALIPKATLAEVSQHVRALLHEAVTPMATVAGLMSYGVQTITATTSVAEAAERMQRSGHEGYPVVDETVDRLVGLLTRRAVDRAMSHHLGQMPVSRVMRAGVVTVRPSDSIERLQHLMLTEGWGQIPVLPESAAADDCLPVGIVTRTDLLTHLFTPVVDTAVPDMRQRLAEILHPALWQMVQLISQQAAVLDMPLYFVGGLVRDLLLDKLPTDLDMVVEGDAITLARNLQAENGGDVHAHGRFGTAKWSINTAVWESVAMFADDGVLADLPDIDAIDFVTARTEFYTEPTALPTVTQGSIKLDLHRRDFAINTLAVRLDGAHLGELLDFYGGQRDLEQGIIRVLHSLSFVDDPTRIMRAFRLEQRLNFKLEPRTAELIDNALPLINRVTGARIRHELELSFREPDPIAVLARYESSQLLAHLYPGLTWNGETAVPFVLARALLQDDAWRLALGGASTIFVYFAIWMLALSEPVREGTMTRLMVRKATRKDVMACHEAVVGLRVLSDNAKPSEIARVLRPYQPRVLLVVRAVLGESRETAWVEQYYHLWRHVKTCITGNTLREMGLKPSPQFTTILDALLAARLDGEVVDEVGERKLLEQLLQ
ncbi:MAG: CBS domain-containing protein [Chloroflexi bacterium]|nr:CBS domain-containing protein [Chloroflexota bacterium]